MNGIEPRILRYIWTRMANSKEYAYTRCFKKAPLIFE